MPMLHPAWESYSVLDLETTGFSPMNDRIVEIAVVRLEAGTVIQRWSSLVNPGRPIPWPAEATHGISDDAVEGAPSLLKLLPTVARLVHRSTIVAHNASFDSSFLPGLRRPWICTLEMARRAFPNAPNHRLGTLINYLGIDRKLRDLRLHRAGADAEATALLLLACLEELPAAA
jgi:DNA polymerase-3 subunit epsilon